MASQYVKSLINRRPLILLVFANDSNEPLDKIQQERQALEPILINAANPFDYEVQIMERSSTQTLIECLDDNYDRLILLHFAGHSNGEVLRLDDGQAHADGGLVEKLRRCQHLQLLFLNGCNNAQQVQAFVAVGIPATIGTYASVLDSVAMTFSASFYRILAHSDPQKRGSIGVAFEQAKASVITSNGGEYRHQTLNVRSLDLDDSPPPTWSWFLEQSSKHDWRLEEAAHPCNRLPVLPTKTLEQLPEHPFKNLYYYTAEDADIFFGRCQSGLDVLARLDDPSFPLLLLHGGTGVGKSSFLMAGLIPRLQARGQAVAKPFRYDERVTVRNLLPSVFGSQDLTEIQAKLHTEGSFPTVWIVDQLEEIFFKTTPPSIDDKDTALSKEEWQENLPDALNLLLKTLQALYPHNKTDTWPNARIIFSLRTEWFGELHDACRQYQLANQDYLLKPLGKNDIIEIVEQPTRRPLLVEKYGLQIANPPDGRLAEQIADDLLEDKESNIAPSLQIMLSKLWQRVQDLPCGQRIWTQDLYEKQKAQGLLLSEHLDQQLREIGEQRNVEHGDWGKRAHESGLLLDVLHAHTTPQGKAKTLPLIEFNRRYTHIPFRDVLAKTLTDRYLLIDPLNNKQQLRLAHDTLAQVAKAKCERSELPGQRARRILDSCKMEWELIDNKPQGTLLLNSNQLKVVNQGMVGTKDSSNDELEMAIIKKSKRHQRGKYILFALMLIPSIFAFWRYNRLRVFNIGMAAILSIVLAITVFLLVVVEKDCRKITDSLVEKEHEYSCLSGKWRYVANTMDFSSRLSWITSH